MMKIGPAILSMVVLFLCGCAGRNGCFAAAHFLSGIQRPAFPVGELSHKPKGKRLSAALV